MAGVAPGRRVEGQAEKAAGYGLSKLYALYAERIAGYAASPPPADWDGVATAREK